MPPSIDVVIPTHGGWPVTASCLRHLREQTRPHRTIVVDDRSPDDTVARIRAEHPEVDLIALEENVGFARACNTGIRAGTGDVVVLLNNDVDAAPTMLERLVEPFGHDALLGSAAPMLLKPDGRIDAVGICADVTLAGYLRHEGAEPSGADRSHPRILGPYGAGAA
ncbi:MAG: glycosyltransferase family 2 protein, partial [Solirubrobacteraceae bacterium]